MRVRIAVSICSVLLLLLSSASSAQTTQLDRFGGGQTFKGNIEFGIGAFTAENVLCTPTNAAATGTSSGCFSRDLTTLRTDIFVSGQFNEIGVYLQLPIHTLFGGDILGGSATQNEVGNLEIGAFYELSLGPVRIMPKLGLTIPLADSNGLFVNALATGGRLTDASLIVPGGVFLRPSLSVEASLGIAFLRVDLGFDFGLSTEEAYDDPVYFRANLALGVQVAFFTLSLELANFARLDQTLTERLLNTELSADDRFSHNLAFVAAFNLGTVAPYFGITLPLDSVDEALYVQFGLQLGM